MAAIPRLVGVKKKGVDKQRLDLKIDGILMDELVATEKRAETEQPDWAINRVEVVEAALREFIKGLNAELDKHARQPDQARLNGGGTSAGQGFANTN